MSELADGFVKRGLWTNLSQGRIMGMTITTDIQTGTIVIALLAIMSTVGTAHLFHLIAFAYHQLRASGKPADGLFRQQQALLRTLPAPSDLVTDSVKLWWYWRRRTDRALTRALPQFAVALSCAIASLAASILSSYVVDSSNLEVLVSSPHCGRVNTTIGDTAPFRTYQTAIYAVAEPYKTSCYVNGTEDLDARCSIFTRPNIPLTMERVACPFDEDMCIAGPDDSPSTPAVALDSGLVDVNSAFGLNLPDRDSVKYRKRTTCGILPDAGYTSIMYASEMDPTIMWLDALPGDQLIMYHYGDHPPGGGEWANMTVGLLTYYANYTHDYSLNSYTTFNDPERSQIPGGHLWEPLPSIQRTDADISYLFVAKNAVKYTYPVDDPLFSAHKGRTHLDSATLTNQTLYISDTPASSIGCTEQYQFCIASAKGDICTSLAGLPLTLSASEFPSANPTSVQLSTLQLLITNSYLHDITENGSFNASGINSGGNVYDQMPKDQWVTEIVQWEQFVWAALQISVADYAIGPAVRTADAASYLIMPETEGDMMLCASQKMRKMGGFVNINFFGLTFILTVSTLLAVIDISLLKFLVYLSKFRAALSPRIDRWIQDGVLQLQRRAFEAQGQGIWTRLDKDVPLTVKGEKLLDLDVLDENVRKTTLARAFTGLTLNDTGSGETLEDQKYKSAGSEGVTVVATVIQPKET